MHEVALSEQLARLVSRAAGGKHVTSISLEIGALRQVVPETLAHAWSFVSARSGLAGSVLDVAYIPGEVRCGRGHITRMASQFDVTCGQCAAPTEILHGQEFRVVSITVNE
ncbi:MAG: hydrogenase maturation nickel metallochaperone HypA [Corynebacterium sp.]|nr:hydrogenase maturation nickel metallochaperone HypA [Corynebacterium sp.]